MKNNGRTWGWVLLAVIAVVGMLLPGGKAYAEGKINLTITSDYILSWDDYPGAAVYYLAIDGGSWNVEMLPTLGKNKIDLKAVIDERVVPPYDLKNNGRHKIIVEGYNEDQSSRLAISEEKIIDYVSPAAEYAPDSVTLSASLSKDGILTWKSVTDAKLYRIFVDDLYSVPFTESMGTKADLKDVINTLLDMKDVTLKSSGTYKITLVAYDGSSPEQTLDTWEGSFKYTAKKPFLDSYVTVTGIKDMTYTGNPITLNLTVKDGSTKLTENKDYKVSYKYNTNVGTATVTLVGTGGYEGTITRYFSILEPSQTSEKTDTNTEKSDVNTDKTDENAEKTEDHNTDPTAAALTKGTPQSSAEALLASVKANKDPVGTEFGKLQLRVSKTAAKKLTLKWKKISGAAKYVMYGNVAGKKPFKKLAEIKKSKAAFTKKSLKPGKWYKLLLIAYDQKGDVLSASKTVYAATTGGKYTNPAKLSTAAKKNKVSVKVKKTFKLKAKAAKASAKLKMKTYSKIRYESSNPKIASVSGKGVIKGKKKGSCYVYAYAQNGVFQKIKVTVKK